MKSEAPNSQQQLVKLVALYSKRFNGGGPPMGALATQSYEELIAQIEQALAEGRPIPGWEWKPGRQFSLA